MLMKERLRRRNFGYRPECIACPAGLICIAMKPPDVLAQCHDCLELEFRYVPEDWVSAYIPANDRNLKVLFRIVLDFKCQCAIRMTNHINCKTA